MRILPSLHYLPLLQLLVVAFYLLNEANMYVKAEDESDVLFDNCEISDYYTGLLNTDGTSLRDDVTRADLETLLETTHRKILPYTASNRDDVWKALMDLDPGGSESDNTVRLIYRQVDAPAQPHGTPATWNREHLWPKSWGVGFTGADFTDIHHLKPSDWNVNSARNNLYFGACGIAEPLSECRSPAHPEASSDTAADSYTFLPPETVRGDIARAIFYMDIRYSNQNNDGLDLLVTDCPTEKPNEMAYKSQLLAWHLADPVSEEERQRNQRACSRWQGNRNVFVDFPELIERFFGTSQTLVGEGLGYASCDTNVPEDDPVTSPTTSPPQNDNPCDTYSPGDVMMVAVSSDNPESIALVALENLEEGLELFLTDNAWTGTSFRTNEGSISFRVPSEGITAGTVFGYGAAENLLYSGDWESAGGRFQLSTSGDNLLLYCRSSDDESSPRFLSAFDFGGNGWLEPNQDEETYETSSSALPEALRSSGAVSVPHFDNYRYIGPKKGSKMTLLLSLSDPLQWEGTNDGLQANAFPQFAITTSESDLDSPANSTLDSQLLSAGDVMVIAMNSVNPDLVALVALKSLSEGTRIYLTDNAWTGSSFRTNEGTLMLSVPNTGIVNGTIFGYGPGVLHGEDWESVGGRFALAESGDTIIVYTEDTGGVIQPVSAFSYYGEDWKQPGLEEDSYGTDSSALPNSLGPTGAISLPRMENYLYIGRREGNKTVLQAALQNASNWEGSIDPVNTPSGSFIVTSSSTRTLSSYWHTWLLVGLAYAFGSFFWNL